MAFLLAGYSLVQGTARQPWTDASLLPETIWSGSECIATKYPDAWIFAWVKNRPADPEICALLQISQPQLERLRRQFDEYLTGGRYGFPNVFLELALAREFAATYLGHIPRIKLLSIALPDIFVGEFLEAFQPKAANIGENGVYQKLRQRQPVEENAANLGYDVIGFDGGGFHSFLCGGMEKDFHQRLGISFNRYGLIDSFASAREAAQLLRGGFIPAEEGFWAAWQISEYPLQGD